MRGIAVGIAFVVGAALAACGLSVTGNGADFITGDAGADGNTAETTPPDVPDGTTPLANDGSDEGAAPTCSCGETAPAGFELAAFRGDQGGACTGDLQTVDRVASPTAGGGACSCNPCTMTTEPSCDGTWTSKYDSNPPNNAQCDMAGADTHPTSSGNCQKATGTFGSHGKLVAPAASGPTACTATSTATQSAAQTKPVRACVARAGGQSCPCGSALPPGFKTCFYATSDVACPNGTTKTSIGTGASVTCDACGCTATNPTCTSKVDFFSDDSCGTNNGTLDATCAAFPVANFKSFRFTGTPSATCQTQPPAGSAVLTGVETICCP